MDAFRTIIIPAPTATDARALAATWPGGVGMWITPLYTGEDVTHYISTGKMSAEIVGWMPWDEYSDGALVQPHSGDVETLVAQINDANPEANVTVEQIEFLLAGTDISNQPWREAVARLGLERYQEAEV